MNAEKEPFEDRLDGLMRMLLVLHEFGVITDPIVTAERAEDGNGTAVTVEFLLDFDADFEPVGDKP